MPVAGEKTMRLDAHFGMLPELAFRPRPDGGMTREGKGGSPPPPNYTPVAQASEKSAELGLQLGREQIAESRRQYDLNRTVSDPVAKAQLDLMNEATRQGQDYYDYGREGRSVERELNRQSMIDRSGQDQSERDLITGGDQGIYNARRADIEAGVDRATADARQGLTGEYNRILRQGLRYGYSPQAMISRFGPNGIASGLGVATAANAARTGGIANARQLLGQNRNLRIQDDSSQWAKKLDVAGLYRGTPGASQGAYGLAVGAGNSAVQNTMAPGSQLLGGMAQGAGTQMAGAAQRVQGLGSVLNAQTGMAGVESAANSAQQGATMGVVAAGIGAAAVIF
jgi:hypothetical protein